MGFLYRSKKLWNRDPNRAQQEVPKKPARDNIRIAHRIVKSDREYGNIKDDNAVIPYKITLILTNCITVPASILSGFKYCFFSLRDGLSQTIWIAKNKAESITKSPPKSHHFRGLLA